MPGAHKKRPTGVSGVKWQAGELARVVTRGFARHMLVAGSGDALLLSRWLDDAGDHKFTAVAAATQVGAPDDALHR